MAAGIKTGGREKGTPNKATADIKALAGLYSQDALDKIVSLMKTAESPRVQLAAAQEILDRAHGKAAQTVAGDPDNPLTIEIRTIERVIVHTPDSDSQRLRAVASPLQIQGSARRAG